MPDTISRFLFYVKLPFYGLWLLLVSLFEDTSTWAEQQITLAKQTFAFCMFVFFLIAVLFSFRALPSGSEEYERRLNRVEVRQDKNFDDHSEIVQRLSKVESDTKHIDRLVYGVIALTFAVLGEWGLQLFKFKLERDERASHSRRNK